jgi:hypothetical protein
VAIFADSGPVFTNIGLVISIHAFPHRVVVRTSAFNWLMIMLLQGAGAGVRTSAGMKNYLKGLMTNYKSAIRTRAH